MNIQSVVIISRAELRGRELVLAARYNQLSKELEALNAPQKFTDRITLLCATAMALESDNPDAREKALKESKGRGGKELEIEMYEVRAVKNFIRDELLKEEVNPKDYGISRAEIS